MTKHEINDIVAELGIIEKVELNKEDITEDMKDKVYEKNGSYYLFNDNGLTEEDIKIGILASGARDIRLIKGMFALFMTIIVIVIFGLLLVMY